MSVRPVSIRMAAAVLLLGCSPASALDCYDSPLRDQRHWSWRHIEGRKCWYPGRPGISKGLLRWTSGSTSVPPDDLTNGTSALPLQPSKSADEDLVESIWPRLPQDSFDERFRGAR